MPRDADGADEFDARIGIRRRRTHPDSGGSSQEFERLKAAYATLLIDEAHRRRDDETGKMHGEPVDRHRLHVMEMLSVGLDLAIRKSFPGVPRPPKHADMVWLTSEALRQRRQEWIGLHRELERMAERSRELQGRFSAASSDNLMEAVVVHRVEACQKDLAACG